MTLEKEKRKLCVNRMQMMKDSGEGEKKSCVNQMQMMKGSTEKISRIVSNWVMTIAPWK
jgi:hypothetical protein